MSNDVDIYSRANWHDLKPLPEPYRGSPLGKMKRFLGVENHLPWWLIA